MNKSQKDLLKEFRESITGPEEVDNLHLTRTEFMEKMKKEKDGQQLLDLLECGEWRVAERMGLINGFRENGDIYFDIPSWKGLVAHLSIVNSV